MTAPRQAASHLRADIHAERVVLGGCLWDTATLAAVRDVIDDPGVFVRPAHQQLYAALCAAADAGGPTDPVSLHRALRASIPGVDGVYLHGLLEACPVPANAVHYATDLTTLARLRHWQHLAQRLLDRAAAPDADPDELDTYAWAHLENAVRAHEDQKARAAAATGRPSAQAVTSSKRRPRHPPGYVNAALRGEVNRVLTASGDATRRLAAVQQAAHNLARLVDDGSLTAELVTEALTAAVVSRGADAAAAAAAIHAGLHAPAGRRTA